MIDTGGRIIGFSRLFRLDLPRGQVTPDFYVTAPSVGSPIHLPVYSQCLMRGLLTYGPCRQTRSISVTSFSRFLFANSPCPH